MAHYKVIEVKVVRKMMLDGLTNVKPQQRQ
jgi:hypothetical protein